MVRALIVVVHGLTPDPLKTCYDCNPQLYSSTQLNPQLYSSTHGNLEGRYATGVIKS